MCQAFRAGLGATVTHPVGESFVTRPVLFYLTGEYYVFTSVSFSDLLYYMCVLSNLYIFLCIHIDYNIVVTILDSIQYTCIYYSNNKYIYR